jgi:hypothetical protein
MVFVDESGKDFRWGMETVDAAFPSANAPGSFAPGARIELYVMAPPPEAAAIRLAISYAEFSDADVWGKAAAKEFRQTTLMRQGAEAALQQLKSAGAGSDAVLAELRSLEMNPRLVRSVAPVAPRDQDAFYLGVRRILLEIRSSIHQLGIDAALAAYGLK